MPSIRKTEGRKGDTFIWEVVVRVRKAGNQGKRVFRKNSMINSGQFAKRSTKSRVKQFIVVIEYTGNRSFSEVIGEKPD